MKLLELLKDNENKLSSTRLFMLLVAISCIIDWQHAVWTVGVWSPEWDVLIFTASVLGLKLWQKKVENPSGTG